MTDGSLPEVQLLQFLADKQLKVDTARRPEVGIARL